jgi:MFS family permease
VTVAPLRPLGPRRVAVVTAAGLGLVMLDNTAVSVALPAIRDSFDAQVADLQWTVSAMSLANAAALPLSGALGDRLGARRTMRIGLTGFAVAAAAASLSPSVGLLVAARALQGVAAAMMLPNAAALLGANVPAAERGAAVGAWLATSSLGLVAGPLAAGVLVDSLGWRAVLLLHLPVAVAGVVGARRLVDARSPARAGWDRAGVLTGGLGLLAVSYGLIELGRPGTRLPLAVLALLAGGALLAGFVAVERRAAAPVLDLALLREPRYAGVLAAALLYNGTVAGGTFLVSLLVQTSRGAGPLAAGVVLLVTTIGMPVGGLLAGRLATRLGLRRLMPVAASCLAGGYALAAALAGAPLGLLLAALAVTGLAVGVLFASDTLAVLEVVDPREAPSGLAALSTVRQVGSVVGVASLGAVAGLAGAPAAGLLAAGLLAVPAVVTLARTLAGPPGPPR